MTARLLVGLVRVYQWMLSPLLGDRCKYHPTCSQYAIDALHEHGAARGTVLAAWRVLRCNPWSAGGVDHARDPTLFRRSAHGRHA
ncbi:MAG TPA: membrane protein insertion efficiency factor YidD [Thermoanaerobaculia bacterium]|nr:membrane protein insertion efficiency factor YidD [Thermoanaerobaculia bacterium]